MFVASLNGERIEADKAAKRSDYTCPECGDPVILHKGKVVTPHYSHRPDASCAFGVGEGKDHMQIKLALARMFRARGLKVAIEYRIGNHLTNQRFIADLYVWENKNEFAVEVVDSHDNLDHIEEKEAFYKALGILCVWFPIVRKAKRAEFKTLQNSRRKNPVKYRPTAFEKWLLDWRKRVHFIIPPNRFVTCRAKDFYIEIPRTDYGGGYSYASKAFRNVVPVASGTLDQLLDIKSATIERRQDFESIVNSTGDE